MSNYTNQPYQVTYLKGAVNITVRGEDKDQVVQDAKDMIQSMSKALGGKKKQPESQYKCEECGAPAEFKGGTSKKTGKPYQMIKCTKNDKHVKFINS
jgi:hypothetical protein